MPASIEQTYQRVLDAMPGSSQELASRTGLHYSTVQNKVRELRNLKRCHVGDYKVHDPLRPANVSNVYFIGPGIDAVYMSTKVRAATPEEKEKRAMYFRKWRSEHKRGAPSNPDEDEETRTLCRDHKRALKQAQPYLKRALAKKNTPFGPLFEMTGCLACPES